MSFEKTVDKILAVYAHWTKNKQKKTKDGLRVTWSKVVKDTITDLAKNPNPENKELLPKYSRMNEETKNKFCDMFFKFRKLQFQILDNLKLKDKYTELQANLLEKLSKESKIEKQQSIVVPERSIVELRVEESSTVSPTLRIDGEKNEEGLDMILSN